MKLVPTVVNGEDGRPVHHGVVERAYDRLRFCVQRYVVDKQEDCIATVCLLCVVRCNAIIRTSSMCVHECVCVCMCHYHEEIFYGEASEVVTANETIKFDEFEHDQTSVRRTAVCECPLYQSTH